MMLSLYKSKAGEIITREVESMKFYRLVRQTLDSIGEINPLYFFEQQNDGFQSFYEVHEVDDVDLYVGEKILRFVPDDIKIETIKWLYPNVFGTYLLCFYVNSDKSISADEAFIGYLQAPKKLGANGTLFYKKCVGSLETFLSQIYDKDFPNLIEFKRPFNGINRAELSLYSVNKDRLIPLDFGSYENLIKINKNTLKATFGVKI